MRLTSDELARRQELLCEKYGAIIGLVTLFGVPPNDRDDVVQEIFVLAYKSLHQLKDMSSLDSWLYKIAYRYVINLKMKKGKKEEFEVPFEDYVLNIRDESSSKHVWEIASHNLSSEELTEMVDSLKPPAPEILRLRRTKDLDLQK